MKKKLTICTENNYFNECWSIEFFSIIDSCAKLKKWKFFHYNFITTNSQNDLIFGFNGTIYNQHAIFNEILNINEYSYCQIKKEKIIDFVKKSIFMKKYVILLLNVKNESEFHEFLFFSFNDNKKIFKYIFICNGKQIVREMPYSILQENYINTILNINNLYYNHHYKLYFFSPITTLKIKKNVDFQNISINSLYLFLKETYNNCWISAKLYFNDVFKYQYFNGLLGIVNAILVEFNKYKRDNNHSYNFAKNIKTYYLYRRFFYSSLSSYKKELKISFKNFEKLEDSFKTIENVLLITLKNSRYSDDQIQNMCNNLIDVFKKDFKYIEETLSEVHNLLSRFA